MIMSCHRHRTGPAAPAAATADTSRSRLGSRESAERACELSSDAARLRCSSGTTNPRVGFVASGRRGSPQVLVGSPPASSVSISASVGMAVEALKREANNRASRVGVLHTLCSGNLEQSVHKDPPTNHLRRTVQWTNRKGGDSPARFWSWPIPLRTLLTWPARLQGKQSSRASRLVRDSASHSSKFATPPPPP